MCIYIDPPYNTGNEGWVYNDNVNSPEIRRWLGEVVGREGETLDHHDRWLCMMYPRLVLLRQLLRKTGLGVATVKRELDRMVEAGLLTRTVIGNQHHHQANPACPIHDQLAAIVRKTLGAPTAIRAALEPLTERIVRAFVLGSFAAGTDQPGSDIDLLVVGDLALAELARVLYPVQQALAREINPKLYRPAEWERMVAHEDAFARELLRKPRIALIGEAA